MQPSLLLAALLTLTAVAYHLGRRRALGIATRAGGVRRLHSLPAYYGPLTALWCGVPALLLLAIWLAFEPTIVTHIVLGELPAQVRSVPEDRLGLILDDIRNQVSGNIVSSRGDPVLIAAPERCACLQDTSKALLSLLVLALAIGCTAQGWRIIRPELRARTLVEKAVMAFLVISSAAAIFTTVGIVLSVLFESLRSFSKVPAMDFLFGTTWSPQTAIRADRVGSSGSFGAVPLLASTILISTIAMLVAAPIGLFLEGTVGDISVDRPRMVTRGIDVFYGDKQAIMNVNLDLGYNEVVSMIGPSGCGKSTFLRYLNRMNDTIEGCRVRGRIETMMFSRRAHRHGAARANIVGMYAPRPNLAPCTRPPRA